MLDDAHQVATKIDGRGQADILKVAATSNTPAVAGAIAGIVRVYEFVEVQAMGADAVNQAVKAIDIATHYLEEYGINIICNTRPIENNTDDQEPNTLRFNIELRPH